MKATLCDICNCPIGDFKHKKIEYKVSKYGRFFDVNLGGFWTGWAKIDVCEDCFDKMINYIGENAK